MSNKCIVTHSCEFILIRKSLKNMCIGDLDPIRGNNLISLNCQSNKVNMYHKRLVPVCASRMRKRVLVDMVNGLPN